MTDEKRRPDGNGAANKRPGSALNAEHSATAAQGCALDYVATAWDREFWFRFGYQIGDAAGYRRCQVEFDQEWQRAIANAPKTDPNRRSYDELLALRATLPEDTDCACPACSARRAVVRRHGGDYLGRPNHRESA